MLFRSQGNSSVDATASEAAVHGDSADTAVSSEPTPNAEGDVITPTATAVAIGEDAKPLTQEEIKRSYQVEVTLEPGMTILVDSMIKVGNYTLIVYPFPKATPMIDSSPDPTDAASSEPTTKVE